MAQHRIIVIGASAGGVMSLQELVRGLSPDIAASIFVVLHLSPSGFSYMPQILTNAGALTASHPENGEPFKVGQIYIAPPDHHLLLDTGNVAVTKGPKENGFRPSIDALFRSAAYTHGSHVIGVVLSGALDDGTSGLWSIKRLGGITIVQQPEEAQVESMPRSAIRQVEVDHVASASRIGTLLSELVQQGIPEEIEPGMNEKERERIEIETNVAANVDALRKGVMTLGELSPITCPECHGVLMAIVEANVTRYRCHTGHAYSASALLAGVTDVIGETLWQAMRGLEECVLLLRNMGDELVAAGDSASAERFFSKAGTMEARSQLLHDLTSSHEQLDSESVRQATPERQG